MSISVTDTKILLLSTITLEVFDKLKIFSPNMKKTKTFYVPLFLSWKLKYKKKSKADSHTCKLQPERVIKK